MPLTGRRPLPHAGQPDWNALLRAGLKQLRRTHGWSAADLARILGISVTTICCWERGTRPRGLPYTGQPPAAILQVLARACGYDDLDDLGAVLGADMEHRPLALPAPPPVATRSAAEPLTKVEVAARLAVTESAVQRMIQNGRLPGAFRRGHRWYVPAETVARVAAERTVLGIQPRQSPAPIQPWTGEQLAVLRELGARGVPAREIAERTGHSVNSVTYQLGKEGMRLAANRRAGYSLRQIGELFGVDSTTVRAWITGYHWLRAQRREISPRRVEWRIERDALEAFLRNPVTWVAWRLADLRDPEWRAWVLQAWPTAIPRWLSVPEIAARFGVSRSNVRTWIASGHLPALHYQHQHFADERTLATFVPPGDV